MTSKEWLLEFFKTFPDDVKARYRKHHQEKEGIFATEKYNFQNRELE